MTSLQVPTEWEGDNPCFLVVTPVGAEIAMVIDLDQPGWAAIYHDLMRGQSTWHLFHKVQGLLFTMVVWEGEQPYYTCKHVGTMAPAERREILAYGIGKKRVDGHVDRVWWLPNGQVTLGDDVEPIAKTLLGSEYATVTRPVD